MFRSSELPTVLGHVQPGWTVHLPHCNSLQIRDRDRGGIPTPAASFSPIRHKPRDGRYALNLSDCSFRDFFRACYENLVTNWSTGGELLITRHQRNQIGTSPLLIVPAGSCVIGWAWRGATAWVQSHFKSRVTRSQYYESLSYNFDASARESSPHLPSVRRGCDRRVLLYVQSGQFHSLGHLSPTSFTSRPCQRSDPSPRYHQAALDPLLPTIRRPPWGNRVQPRTIDRTFFHLPQNFRSNVSLSTNETLSKRLDFLGMGAYPKALHVAVSGTRIPPEARAITFSTLAK